MSFSQKPKPVGPGPSGSLLFVDADQDRKNSGTTLTRTVKNFKTSDRTRTQTNLKSRTGLDRTRTNKILKISPWFGPVGPCSPCRKDPSKIRLVPRIFKLKTMPLQNIQMFKLKCFKLTCDHLQWGQFLNFFDWNIRNFSIRYPINNKIVTHIINPLLKSWFVGNFCVGGHSPHPCLKGSWRRSTKIFLFIIRDFQSPDILHFRKIRDRIFLFSRTTATSLKSWFDLDLFQSVSANELILRW